MNQGEAINFKIGRTKNAPHRRINTSSRTNAESYTKIVDYFSKHHHFMEWITHRYFWNRRVWWRDIHDGKTEWFVLTRKEALDGLRKINLAMQIVYGDLGEKQASDRVAEL